MGYSVNDGVVRGELFVRRPESEGFSGKWKYTIALDMSKYWSPEDYITPVDAVRAAWDDGKQNDVVTTATGFWLVVFEPYHKNSCPVMVAI